MEVIEMTKMCELKGTIYNAMGGHYSANKHTIGDGRANNSATRGSRLDKSQNFEEYVLEPTFHITFTEWVSKLPFDTPTEYPDPDHNITTEELRRQCSRVNSRKVFAIVRIGRCITRLS